MPSDSLSLSGLALMLALGLRHGLDPDHLAVIDALSLRLAERRPRWAAWTGAFFALGHGAVVTLIAVGVSIGAQAIHIPPAVYAVTEWLPVLLLLLMGFTGLRRLLSHRPYRHAGWATRLLPQSLLRMSHPLGVMAVGAVFAVLFDTVAQATTWGYIATERGGVTAAWLAGLAFTAGMVCTDTLDSQLLCRLLRMGSTETIERRQRRLGWVIVTLSLSVAAYNILQRLWPAMTLDERSYSLLGLMALVALVTALAGLRGAPPRQPQPRP